MPLRKRFRSEFRPDVHRGNILKTLRLTRQQRLRLTKWCGYALSIVLALVLQDVLMSQISIFGATTELAVTVILLITVLEGTEVGSLFVLIASLFYYFSGTAPGAYSIGLLCFLGIGATLLRQMYWNRSKSTLILCAGMASLAYQIGLYAVGIFSGLTLWNRLPVFLLTGLFNILALIPLYPPIYKIGLIGGNTWKE